jgi:hypothetical protein
MTHPRKGQQVTSTFSNATSRLVPLSAAAGMFVAVEAAYAVIIRIKD